MEMPAVEGGRRMNDLISRKAAIKAIDNLPNCYNGYSDTYDKAYIIGVLEELPSVEKHGRWAKAERDGCWSYSEAYKQCSECGKVTFLAKEMNYCPNCGAKMEEA